MAMLNNQRVKGISSREYMVGLPFKMGISRGSWPLLFGKAINGQPYVQTTGKCLGSFSSPCSITTGIKNRGDLSLFGQSYSPIIQGYSWMGSVWTLHKLPAPLTSCQFFKTTPLKTAGCGTLGFPGSSEEQVFQLLAARKRRHVPSRRCMPWWWFDSTVCRISMGI